MNGKQMYKILNQSGKVGLYIYDYLYDPENSTKRLLYNKPIETGCFYAKQEVLYLWAFGAAPKVVVVLLDQCKEGSVTKLSEFTHQSF